MKMKQGTRESLKDYHTRFSNLTAVLQETEALAIPTSLVNREARLHGRVNANAEDRDDARQAYLAIRFIRGASSNSDGYRRNLKNSYTLGDDKYPKTVREAYSQIKMWEDPTARREEPTDTGTGVAFAQESHEIVPPTYGPTRTNVQCYVCRRFGHFADRCPTAAAGYY